MCSDANGAGRVDAGCNGWGNAAEARVRLLHGNIEEVLDLARHASKWEWKAEHRAVEKIQVGW